MKKIYLTLVLYVFINFSAFSMDETVHHNETVIYDDNISYDEKALEKSGLLSNIFNENLLFIYGMLSYSKNMSYKNHGIMAGLTSYLIPDWGFWAFMFSIDYQYSVTNIENIIKCDFGFIPIWWFGTCFLGAGVQYCTAHAELALFKASI